MIIVLVTQNIRGAHAPSAPPVPTPMLSGGHLAPVSSFGEDPLAGRDDLVLMRQQAMDETAPSPQELFSDVANGSDASFALAIQFMVEKMTSLLIDV